ncbi:unnamed protein product [Prunus armeniaca]|uniref:Retrotransposon Copia-like N-terminal domain-containing protein n=1 Tax=Prunus armeniaca TaxID=36596 RepID=A0A6J5TK71_PRUAR|nr:unnamed protein product [Prunus armeniaca]
MISTWYMSKTFENPVSLSSQWVILLGELLFFSGESDGNPNLRLCSVLLNGFNYIPWSIAVSLALGGRSKLGFINGNILAPAVDDPKYEDWFCKDQLVMSWLLNSMEPQVAEIFSFFF